MRTTKKKDSSSPAKPTEGVSGANGLGERDGRAEKRSEGKDPGLNVNTETEKMSDRDSPGVGVIVIDGEIGSKRDGNGIGEGCSNHDVTGKEGNKSVVETLQAGLERVSISEEAPQALSPASGSGSAPSTPCVAETEVEKKPAPQAATEPVSEYFSQALSRSLSSLPSSFPPPVSTTTTAPSPGSTAWESMKFGRPSGAPSAVSLQASLLAEAHAVAAETAVAASADTCIDPAAKAVTATTTTSKHGIIRLEHQNNRQDGEANKNVSSAKARRKSVTFVDGTKEDPPPSTVRLATLSKRSSRSASGVNGRIGKRSGRGRGRGRGEVNGAGRSKGDKTVTKSVVLEKVVEREPSMPSPMEVKVAGEGKARVVEGHLPSIEADLSFRVLPRGYCPQGRGVPLFEGIGDAGGVREEKGSGDIDLVDDGDDTEVMGDLIDGDMKEEENNGGLSGGMDEAQEVDNGDDDDENDRCAVRR